MEQFIIISAVTPQSLQSNYTKYDIEHLLQIT